MIHDEIDLPFGEIQERLGGGLAGHNGLKSVSQGVGGPRLPARPRRRRQARLDRPRDRFGSRALALLRARARGSRADRARRRLRPARRRELTDIVRFRPLPGRPLAARHQAAAARGVRRAAPGRDAVARDRAAGERAERLLRDGRSRFGDAGARIRRVQPAARQADRPPRADAGARQLRDRVSRSRSRR